VIGLDTNVLIHFFLQDDAEKGEKGKKASELMSTLTVAEPGWVGTPVLIDLVWEMTHTHKIKRIGVIQILDQLLSSQEITVQNSDTVREALRLYRSRNTEFADCLIACSAKAAGCSRTVTFDRRAARDAGMELLG
jgi:predicted nucleic-acid-binding protein